MLCSVSVGLLSVKFQILGDSCPHSYDIIILVADIEETHPKAQTCSLAHSAVLYCKQHMALCGWHTRQQNRSQHKLLCSSQARMHDRQTTFTLCKGHLVKA